MNTDWHTKNNFDDKPIRSSVRKLSLELQKTNSIWIEVEVEAFFVSPETVHLQQQCCFNANENWIDIKGTFEYKKADNNCYAKAAMKAVTNMTKSNFFPVY